MPFLSTNINNGKEEPRILVSEFIEDDCTHFVTT